MKSCRGCRNLVTGIFAVCKAIDSTLNRQERGPDGVTRTIYGLRPTIVKMREAGEPCGPDAVLWRPNWWWSITGRKLPQGLGSPLGRERAVSIVNVWLWTPELLRDAEVMSRRFPMASEKAPEMVLFTSGEYSDYRIFGMLEVPSQSWVLERMTEFRTAHPEMGIRFAPSPFYDWLLTLEGVRPVEYSEAWLGGYGQWPEEVFDVGLMDADKSPPESPS